MMKEPEWMREYRKQQLAIAVSKPVKKSQYYDVQELDKSLILPEKLSSLQLPVELEKYGIIVMSWEQAIKEREKEIKLILANEEKPRNQYEAWINANFNTGFVAVVKGQEGSKIAEYKLEDSNDCIIKNLIIMEENASLKMLEHLNGNIKHVNETLYVKSNSDITFCRIFNLENNSLINHQAVLARDSRLLAGNAYLNGNAVHVRTTNLLNEQDCWLEQLDFSFLNKNQFYNIDLKTIHNARDAYSNSLLRSVIKDDAKSLFNGMVRIMREGQKANAMLQAHSLLLSKDASANNIPNLEIEADDVKAGHSASVSNIDDDQLFYLESKGIRRDEAIQMIIRGFLDGIIYKLPAGYHEALAESLVKKIWMDYENN